MPGYAGLYAGGVLLESLRGLWAGNPFLSLHAQYLLAGIILVYGAVCWGRSAAGRSALLR